MTIDIPHPLPEFLPELLGPESQARRRALYDHPFWQAIEDGSAAGPSTSAVSSAGTRPVSQGVKPRR